MRILVIAALLAAGCGNAYNPVASSGTEQEAWILAETARIAGVLNVRVHGELTDHVYSIKQGTGGCPADYPTPCIAGGWLEGGTAYYYRPWVLRQSLENLTDTAGHEVCHAVSFFHDVKHWTCMAQVAHPTYPFPEVKP